MPNWNCRDELCVTDPETLEQKGRFRIKTAPKGIRGVRLIGGLLRRILPFSTHSRPSFHIRVERLDSETDPFTVSLAREYVRTRESEYKFLSQKAVGAFERDFTDGYISWTGEYEYELSISVSVHSEPVGILSFYAFSEDRFISGLVPTLISGAIAIAALVVSIIALGRG